MTPIKIYVKNLKFLFNVKDFIFNKYICEIDILADIK